jgi:hypothetical protein
VWAAEPGVMWCLAVLVDTECKLFVAWLMIRESCHWDLESHAKRFADIIDRVYTFSVFV